MRQILEGFLRAKIRAQRGAHPKVFRSGSETIGHCRHKRPCYFNVCRQSSRSLTACRCDSIVPNKNLCTSLFYPFILSLPLGRSGGESGDCFRYSRATSLNPRITNKYKTTACASSCSHQTKSKQTATQAKKSTPELPNHSPPTSGRRHEAEPGNLKTVRSNTPY